MIRALYTAASGMVAQSNKQDIIANNLANAQTPGFKRLRTINSSFAEALNSASSASVIETTPGAANSSSLVESVKVNATTATDSTEGAITPTGNIFQFAIQGPGTFEVGSGIAAHQTRNGSFTIDIDGDLANSDGEKVQGSSGAIKVPHDSWSVSESGSILNSKGEEIDRIKINGAEAGKTSVVQGSIEQSNVSVVREMVDMITNLRSFEANQKVVQSVDQTLDKLINEAGKV